MYVSSEEILVFEAILSEKAKVVSAGFSSLQKRLQSAFRWMLNQKPGPQATTFKVCKWDSLRERQQNELCDCFLCAESSESCHSKSS